MPPIRRVSGSTRSKSSSSTAYQLPQFVPPAPSSLARLLNPPSPMLASSALDAAYAPSLSYQPPSAPLESQLMHWEEASSGTEHDASGDDEDYKPTKEKRSRVTGKVQWIVKPSKPRSRLDSPFVPAGSTSKSRFLFGLTVHKLTSCTVQSPRLPNGRLQRSPQRPQTRCQRHSADLSSLLLQSLLPSRLHIRLPASIQLLACLSPLPQLLPILSLIS